MPHAIKDCLVLDIQKLIRCQAVMPGFPQNEVRVAIDARNGKVPADRLVTINSWYPTNGDPAIQVFMADGSSHVFHFRCIDRGVAKRWFFVAPNSETGELVRKLYLPRGCHSFDTRAAHKIPYPGRDLKKRDRLIRQIMKLRVKLGFTPDIHDDFGPKPYRMRTKTFKRAIANLDALMLRLRLTVSGRRGRPSKASRHIAAMLDPADTPTNRPPLAPGALHPARYKSYQRTLMFWNWR